MQQWVIGAAITALPADFIHISKVAAKYIFMTDNIRDMTFMIYLFLPFYMKKKKCLLFPSGSV